MGTDPEQRWRAFVERMVAKDEHQFPNTLRKNAVRRGVSLNSIFYGLTTSEFASHNSLQVGFIRFAVQAPDPVSF